MAYTFAQLEGLWIQAGGSRGMAPVMAAIALAESGGNPNAENRTDNGGRQTSWGLWQISNGTHNEPVPNILNPEVNARAAVAKLNSQGLGAWGTYTSGAYKHFLGSQNPAIPPAVGKVVGAVGKTGQTSSGGGGLGDWFHSIWLGLSAGLGVSAAAGNEPAQAVIGTVNAPSNLGAVADSIAGLTLPFVVLARAVDWFFVPSHWVRIIAGLAGAGLAAGGLYELTQTGEKPAALPLGIAGIGFGAVLLVVAFHNLDPSIKTPGEFAAHLQEKIQSPSGTSPAAAVSAAGG